MARRFIASATRFALILALAAVLPAARLRLRLDLISLQRGTRESVVTGNQNVAARAAEEIRRYVSGHADILKALGADLQDTDLEPWQQDRILKNYILQFREFREITLFDEAGGSVATSRVGPPRVRSRPTRTVDRRTAWRCRRSASTTISCRQRSSPST